MSRTVNLALTQPEVEKHCRTKKVDVSLIEPLPGGGVRLVCSSSAGAEKIRSTLRSKLIHGDVQRTEFGMTRTLT